MSKEYALNKIRDTLTEGLKFSKCNKCVCMKEALIALKNSLPLFQTEDSRLLEKETEEGLQKIKKTEYTCLGCDYCYGAEVTNLLNEVLIVASTPETQKLSIEDKEQTWPHVPGEYFILNDAQSSPIAISTLGSVDLAQKIADLKPKGVCIVGKTETENIGIEKVIKNIISNGNIRYLLLVGTESKGHNSGNTFMALYKNGIDGSKKVIGSSGKNPVLINTSQKEIVEFRHQVEVIDMIDCIDLEKIMAKVNELVKRPILSYGYDSCQTSKSKPIQRKEDIPLIIAEEATSVKLDKEGYFVIIPQPKDKTITVEHYSYKNKLLRVIKGTDPQRIYKTIIDNGWISQLSHAAYLGKELAKAELSLKLGFKYVQEGA